jgi:hypothetical protein
MDKGTTGHRMNVTAKRSASQQIGQLAVDQVAARSERSWPKQRNVTAGTKDPLDSLVDG